MNYDAHSVPYVVMCDTAIQQWKLRVYHYVTMHIFSLNVIMARNGCLWTLEMYTCYTALDILLAKEKIKV